MTPADVFAPETEDRSFARDQMVRDWLRKPFKPEQIGKIPATARRPALDYVGHASVTDRLNKIAPDTSWTIDETFLWEESYWVRGTFTVGGVSRAEFGDGKDPKEAIGNFIRRGAMRFGVAIDLWSREELETSGAGRAAGDSKALPAPDETSVTAVGADSTATAVDKPEVRVSPLNGEAAGEPAPSAPNELWDKAREIGLSPPKAVVMARRRGWDHVRTSTDLSDAQLAELILIRKEELA